MEGKFQIAIFEDLRLDPLILNFGIARILKNS